MAELLIADFGNSTVKVMLAGKWGSEINFKHFVEPIDKQTYDLLSNSFDLSLGFGGTAIFETGGKYYRVGNGADSGKRINGANKYSKDHITVTMLASLLHLLPATSTVNVIVTHPAKATPTQIKMLIDALQGKYTVSVPSGNKQTTITYTVNKVNPIPEIVAGFQDFLINRKGTEYKQNELLKIGSRFLIFDGGGKISGFAPMIINDNGRAEIAFNPRYQLGINAGVQDVEIALNNLLLNNIPAFSKFFSVPLNLLHEAIHTGSIKINKDVTLDVSAYVDQAMAVLATGIYEQFESDYNLGVGFEGVLILGGGGGITSKYMSKTVFQNMYTYLTEPDINKMQYDKIYGANKGLLVAKAQKARLEQEYQANNG